MILSLIAIAALVRLGTSLQIPTKNNNNQSKVDLKKTIDVLNLQKVNAPSLLQVTGFYGVTPVIPAVVLPMLTDTFRATQNPSDLLAVLIAKRSFIYILATVTTAYAGWRATTDLSAGESLDALNREIIKGRQYDTNRNGSDEKDQAIFAPLDKVDNVNQNVAFALPILLASSLGFSYMFIKAQQGLDVIPSVQIDDNINLLELAGNLITFSNLMVCLLFASTEYRSYTKPQKETNGDNSENEVKYNVSTGENIVNIPNILACITVSMAWLLPTSQAWPFQNSVNMTLAVTVTRAIAPFLLDKSGSVRIVALALGGLALYDVTSVFGAFSIDPASAADFTSTTASPMSMSSSSIIADKSIMETVARSKMEGSWRPGLLEMVLVGRVSDVIGLGDVIFPACLVSWGYSFHKLYAFAAIVGYILGSVITEAVSTFGPTQGLPALIFLVPAMLGSVSVVALQRDEFNRVWGVEEPTNMT
jgi:hypothetical protein